MSAPPKLSTCHLCERQSKLCNSHIVPEFLYAPLYDTDDRLMAINGRGAKGWRPLNKGMTEHLFCAECELLLNREYEQPFQKQWFGAMSFPDHMENYAAFSAVFDYQSFKLFHLSILFRCSISSNPMFSAVALGKHEKRIREMLITQDPGLQTEYPILGFAMLGRTGEIERRIISRPVASRYENEHRIYGQIYAGVMWWTSVSSGNNTAFCENGLQTSGDMTFLGRPWREIGIMQLAGNALRRSN